MPVSLPSAADPEGLRMFFIRWSLVVLVCLGVLAPSVSAAPTGATLRPFGEANSLTEIGVEAWPQDAPRSQAVKLGALEASGEEEDERDDHLDTGEPPFQEGQGSAAVVVRAWDGCEGFEPSSTRPCLDARGPPAR